MIVDIHVNALPSGRVEVCVVKPGANPHPVQTYRSSEEARKVLLALGIVEEVINERLDLLSEVGSREVVKLVSQEVSTDDLWAQGFKM